LSLTLVALGFCYGFYAYASWLDRVSYLKWMSQRQASLKALWERVNSFAEQNDGALPCDIQGYLDAEVLAASEIEFFHSSQNVQVKRVLRPIPRIDLNEDLILFLERYDPWGDGANILYLSGHVSLTRKFEETIAKDNKLRCMHNMPEIP